MVFLSALIASLQRHASCVIWRVSFAVAGAAFRKVSRTRFISCPICWASCNFPSRDNACCALSATSSSRVWYSKRACSAPSMIAVNTRCSFGSRCPSSTAFIKSPHVSAEG